MGEVTKQEALALARVVLHGAPKSYVLAATRLAQYVIESAAPTLPDADRDEVTPILPPKLR